MNEEIREFAEDLQDHIKKCNKLLNKLGQSMGQRNNGGGQGYGQHGGQMGYRENGGQWNGNMNDRNDFFWPGYDPRFI